MIRLYLYAALIGAVIAFLGGLYWKAYTSGKKACQSDIIKNEINLNKSRERINHDVQGLDHDSIVKQLADGGWLRND